MKKNQDLSVQAGAETRIGIAMSRYNTEITSALLNSCFQTLLQHGMDENRIQVVEVPGAFELPYACQKMALSKKFDALIALGAIVRGGTPHFDYVAEAATQGVLKVGLKHHIPIIFGVLTTDNQEQALDRIQGGKNGDKGVEAALTALRMATLAKLAL
ncbi:6,7-dimethyl-8-ribityllumazine synthase [Candidatus Peregrinibacteria bacterium]|nr:6,7-dimethyl-8-ribityllumazine synthase [Candidatus Peregrinibacteria bacterium]